MEIITTYHFTRTNSYSKDKKKGRYIPRGPWKIFLTVVLLFSTAYAVHITKEEVADTLLKYFNPEGDQDLSIPNIYSYIDDADSMYSIDFKDCNLEISENLKNFQEDDWNRFKEILTSIRAIRCNSMYLRIENLERVMPLSIIKMIIERVVAIEVFQISSVFNTFIHNEDVQDITTDYNIDDVAPNMLLDPVWEETNPLDLYIYGCSSKLTKIVMEHYKTRPLNFLLCSHIGGEKMDLSNIIISDKFNIELKNLLKVESIVFPDVSDISCETIDLHNIPHLKELIGGYKFLSTNRSENQSLTIDGNIFKFCRNSFTEEMTSTPKKFLEVKKLELMNMPSTDKEIQKLFFSPWICANTMHIQILPRTCYVSNENVEKLYTLEVIARMGIQLTNNDKYAYSIQNPNEIETYTHEFLKSIAMNSNLVEDIKIMCPSLSYIEENDRIECTVSYIRIDLSDSDKIKAAIKKLQTQYDTLCVHVGYIQILINGFDAPKNWTEVLSSLLACMGHGITAKTLSFCNMEEPIEENAQEKTDDSCIRVRKYKFILDKLIFGNCKIGFIRHMLTKYSYAPKAKIHIDCRNFEEEEIWSICQNTVDYQFSKVVLNNASNLMKRMQEKGYIFSYNMEDVLILELGNPQWLIENSQIVKYIFQERSTLSTTYLSTLASKHKDSPNGEQSEKDLCQFLVGISIAEACSELKDFSTTIDRITFLGIFIHNSDTAPFTTVEELFAFIKIIRDIFVDMKLLSIFNLRIKEEETHRLSELNALVNTEDKHKLKNIFLRDYKIAGAKDTALSGESETKTLHYSIGGSYLRYLLENRLKEKNVSISCKALSLLFGDNSESNSNVNLEEWEKRLINDELCPVCYDSSEISEIYIMHRCKHCVCRTCALGCYTGGGNTCPFCRTIANFNRPFYTLQLKDITKENPTEEDFEFVETHHL
ncbi:hypothetical protein NEFER01_2035 [Nematocida sp. LUAm1]|nr:hypothetical protein NEFER02_2237 [Nematocida sp. LUAm2]KAI5179172.1 hypothetical protein NEFER01_2035 [Nematocida sp. LUAm1]